MTGEEDLVAQGMEALNLCVVVTMHCLMGSNSCGNLSVREELVFAVCAVFEALLVCFDTKSVKNKGRNWIRKKS